MAFYQSKDILKDYQVKGSYAVFYAPYVLDHTTAVWVEVGMVDDPSFVENMEFLDGSASNAAKAAINTGVSKQELAIAFNPWAYDVTNTMFLRGGIDTLETDGTTGVDSVFTGGGTNIEPFMIKFTNRREDTANAEDVAKYTAEALTVGDPIYRDLSAIGFKCTPTAGTSLTGKRDDDTDAAQRFPMTFQGIEDTDRPDRKQLSVTIREVTKVTA